jgi:hypothetical protein
LVRPGDGDRRLPNGKAHLHSVLRPKNGEQASLAAQHPRAAVDTPAPIGHSGYAPTEKIVMLA